MAKMKTALKGLLAGGLAMGAMALPSGAAQAAEIGQVCNTLESWYVVGTPGGSTIYMIGAGSGFRIEGFAGSYYYGHANGQPNGYLERWVINQPTCHW